MDAVVEELSKPVFWVSVMIFGVIASVVASYVKTALDKLLEGSAIWHRTRSEKRQIRWRAQVAHALSGPEARAEIRHDELRARTQALTFLLMSVLFLLLGTSDEKFRFEPVFDFWQWLSIKRGLGFMGLIVLMFGTRSVNEAANWARVLRAARKAA